MNCAWVYPKNCACGISFYAQKYISAITSIIPCTEYDSSECMSNYTKYAQILNGYSAVHFQYESSYFYGKNRKFFEKLCTRITQPKIVTVHEIYEQFPNIFPRTHIQGKGFVRIIKQWLYDYRHPCQTAFFYHLRHSFYAQKIIVHAHYQKEILMKQKVKDSKVSVIAIPITEKAITEKKGISPPILLSSCGFINESYDYELLFQVLEKLDVPWRFTWIGGVRKKESQALLNDIKSYISKKNWQNIFEITGWLSEHDLDLLVEKTDIYLALFKYKSSSSSLAKALGFRKKIIATSLALTQELVTEGPIMSVLPPKADEIIKEIKKFLFDAQERIEYQKSIDKYIKDHSYSISAQKLIDMYRELS